MTTKRKRITAPQIDARVAEIREAQNDYEHAHALRDDLFTDVLMAIADGQQGAIKLAKAALVTQGIEFPEHCA